MRLKETPRLRFRDGASLISATDQLLLLLLPESDSPTRPPLPSDHSTSVLVRKPWERSLLVLKTGSRASWVSLLSKLDQSKLKPPLVRLLSVLYLDDSMPCLEIIWWFECRWRCRGSYTFEIWCEKLWDCFTICWCCLSWCYTVWLSSWVWVTTLESMNVW